MQDLLDLVQRFAQLSNSTGMPWEPTWHRVLRLLISPIPTTVFLLTLIVVVGLIALRPSMSEAWRDRLLIAIFVCVAAVAAGIQLVRFVGGVLV